MHLKRSVLSLLAGAALIVPASALADRDDDRDSDRRSHRDHRDRDRVHREHRRDWRDEQRDWQRRYVGHHQHQHGGSCTHGPLPAPPPGYSHADRGRYELRTVRTWVEGRWVRDWVAGRCVHKRNGRVKCKEGHSVDRWVPGHYQQSQQWVWVPRRAGWRLSMSF